LRLVPNQWKSLEEKLILTIVKFTGTVGTTESIAAAEGVFEASFGGNKRKEKRAGLKDCGKKGAG